MMIKGILKSWFWISPHQGMLSILCSRIQDYMLSLMNEVDLCLLLLLCVLHDMQNQIFQHSHDEHTIWSGLFEIKIWLKIRIRITNSYQIPTSVNKHIISSSPWILENMLYNLPMFWSWIWLISADYAN